MDEKIDDAVDYTEIWLNKLDSTEKTLLLVLYNTGSLTNLTMINKLLFDFFSPAVISNKVRHLKQLKLIVATKEKPRLVTLKLSKFCKIFIEDLFVQAEKWCNDE